MNKIAKVCLWALAFTPFMFAPAAFSPFIMGENLFLRGAILFASVFFIIAVSRDSTYRETIIQKSKRLVKNPLALSVFLFIFLSVVSTIFAVDTYTAFWSTAQRGEGLLALIFFFLYFLLSVFLFEKKDWFIFFKLHILASLAVLVKQCMQLLEGAGRPGSFLDNPSFLAGYLIFSIFCSLIILSQVKNIFWKYISFVTLILSIVGIFITQTRGTFVALVVGFLCVLTYVIVRGKQMKYLRVPVRKIALLLLVAVLAFSTLFISTRKSEIWNKVPGLSRVAVMNTSDDTIQTRLMMSRIGLSSVNPQAESIKKSLIGWGPENFIVAYTKYFNPKQFDYEITWFDRAHNKFVDVLVMTGLLGLLAYLSIFLFYFRSFLKKKTFSYSHIAFLAFGVMLLVHLFFLFDHITTMLALFSVLAFVIGPEVEVENNREYSENVAYTSLFMRNSLLLVTFFLIVTSLLIFGYVQNNIIANTQMRRYDIIQKTKDTAFMSTWMHTVFEPFTLAQKPIRAYFLVSVQELDIVKDPHSLELVRIALAQADRYLEKVPADYQFLLTTAITYTDAGKDLKDMELVSRGETLLRSVLEYNPQKIDVGYALAINLFTQEKYEESFENLETVFDSSPAYFSFQKKENNDMYLFFIQYFSEKKDKKNFMKAVERLKGHNDMPKIVTELIQDKLLEFK